MKRLIRPGFLLGVLSTLVVVFAVQTIDLSRLYASDGAEICDMTDVYGPVVLDEPLEDEIIVDDFDEADFDDDAIVEVYD